MSFYLDVRPDAIPPALQALPAVLWRAEPRPGEKPAKVPYRIADPEQCAKSTDPSTWGTFGDAVDAYAALVTAPPDPRRGPVVGVGVVLTAAAGLVCLDLDQVLAGDTLDPRAARIVAHCASWTERSPSGTGLHVWGRGTLGRAMKGPGIEVYGDRRYICLTGHHWPGTPPALRDLQGYLDQLAGLERPPRRDAYTGPTRPPPDDLGGALLAKVRAWNLQVVGPLKRWEDGYLVELVRCPWAIEHSTGPGGAWVAIRRSGAFNAGCQHAHCAGRAWRDFRAVGEAAR